MFNKKHFLIPLIGLIGVLECTRNFFFLGYNETYIKAINPIKNLEKRSFFNSKTLILIPLISFSENFIENGGFLQHG